MPVFLVFARLSHYSKMDLTPLLFALQRAGHMGLVPGEYILLVAGQETPGAGMPQLIRYLASNAGIRLHLEFSPDEALKAELYAAADVFVSPVDNIQETFGITLVEAASSGLPVIASDYDGYRDIVVPDETGLLIRTFAPGRTPKQNITAPLLGDNIYHLELSQQTIVDVAKLAEALARLGTDARLRSAMGAKAYARYMEKFTWPKVIGEWTRLWEALWEAPVNADSLRTIPHPLEVDFGATFAAYPTAAITGENRHTLYVRQSRRGQAVYRERDFPILYAGIESTIPLNLLRQLLVIARKPVSLNDLRGELLREESDANAVDSLIFWSCKNDLIEFCDPEKKPSDHTE
jgi:hypothetical protein